MKKIWLSILLFGALSLAFLAGCTSNNNTQTGENVVFIESVIENSSTVQNTTDTESTVENTEVANSEVTLEETEEVTEYTSVSNTVNLSDYEANSIVTINTAGEYALSGTLSSGQVVVNVGDDEEVQLFLNNMEITNSTGSAILVKNAEKVTLTLVEGSINTITDGSNYTHLDEGGEPDAAIFSHDDLTINGGGSLTVYGNYSEGIESRDDLKIKGGNIAVSAVNIGLFGNNSIEIEDTVLVISAGGDSVHSDGDLLVESGVLTLDSGDDGMHADATLTINDGTIDVQMSYEGLEANNVVINGGAIDIVASDDGINAAGGNDSSGMAGMGPQDNFSGSQSSIIINGGMITITAGTSGNGDGLDANGIITITGGNTVIVQPASVRDYTNIDYNISFSFTGGRVRILEPNGTYTEVTENYSSGGPGGGRPGR